MRLAWCSWTNGRFGWSVHGCEKKLRELCERRFDTTPPVVICIDGVRFGDRHVIVWTRRVINTLSAA